MIKYRGYEIEVVNRPEAEWRNVFYQCAATGDRHGFAFGDSHRPESEAIESAKEEIDRVLAVQQESEGEDD